MGETKREHYIPKGYLKGFSCDGKQVFRYDKEKCEDNKLIGISDLFIKKNLYEVKDEKGDFIDRGALELKIKEIEDAFYDVLRRIKLIEIPTEHTVQCVLKTNEKNAIRNMITLQILRTREKIEMAVNLANEQFQENPYGFNLNQLALNSCVPLSLSKTEVEWLPWNVVRRWTENKAFLIKYDPDGRFITSDCPVCIYCNIDKTNHWSEINPSSIIYPLSSKYLLCMHDIKKIEVGYRNILEKATSDDVQIAQETIIACAKRWIITPDATINKEIEQMIG